MELATSAAELGLWVWEIKRDAIWATDKARALFGFSKDEPLDFALFIGTLHAEDRDAVRTVEKSFENGGDYRSEYRIVRDRLTTRWISTQGRVEFDAKGQAVRMRGGIG